VALSTYEIPIGTQTQWYHTKYVTKGQLPRQCNDGELFWNNEIRIAIFAGVQRYGSLQTGTKEVYPLLQ
jgi:hypothetical protein